MKAQTVFLKKMAYGIAGFLSFWIFCGSLKKSILEMFTTAEEESVIQIT